MSLRLCAAETARAESYLSPVNDWLQLIATLILDRSKVILKDKGSWAPLIEHWEQARTGLRRLASLSAWQKRKCWKLSPLGWALDFVHIEKSGSAGPFDPSAEGEEMTPRTMPVFSRVFALEVDGKPTLTSEGRNVRQAQELCKESWLRDDLAFFGIGRRPALHGRV